MDTDDQGSIQLATPEFASTVSTVEMRPFVPSPLFSPPVVVEAVAAEPPPSEATPSTDATPASK